MTATAVRLGHQSRVITSNAKVVLLVSDRLEQTVGAEIKQHKLIFRQQVLISDAYAIYVLRRRATKIFHALEAAVGFRQRIGPRNQIACLQQLREIARLNRRIAN